MPNYAQELFLLTTTISQLNSKDGIIRLFIESMNNIFQPASFSWLSEKRRNGGLEMEVCTRKKTYGYLSLISERTLDRETENLIHNAIQILAILLEKSEQENNLQQLVDQRTAELSRANEDLEKSNLSLQEQIHAHTGTLRTLRKSEEKYKSLINKVQTAIILHDGRGNIIDTNPLADQLLGFLHSSIKGKHPDDKSWHFIRDDGTLMPVTEYPISLVLEQKKAIRNYIVGIIKEESREPVWVLVNAEPEFDERGEIIQVIISFIDITERRKMDDLLRQSQKMDAIGQLAGGVAHDFNNMLGGIIGAAQLLQSPERNLDRTGLEFVDMILDASTQAANLTNKLLTFGRKTEISTRPVPVHDIIRDMMTLLNRTIDKRIEIHLSEKAEQSTVLGDGASLQNALLNLGINASHAMPDGGELRISTKNIFLDDYYCRSVPFEISPGNFIEIEVRDTGTGIPPERIGKIFEPFYTTKKQGKGTGLGLSTVYATIENHRGAINVYSEEGEGTVFHLYLPCSEDSPVSSSPKDISFSGKGHILLADDEELIRRTGKEILKGMGFSVTLASNGREVVELFKERHALIDLVIMDMLMPEMNGSDAFFKMKEIDGACKVIISSGFTKDENIRKMKEAGLAGFIQKPFMYGELSRLLRDILAAED